MEKSNNNLTPAEHERLSLENNSHMDIYVKKGTRVRFIEKNPSTHQIRWGSHSDPSVLEIGKEYTIEETDVRSSHTRVYLQEFPGEYFNSVWFEMVDNYSEDVKEEDMSFDEAKNKIEKCSGFDDETSVMGEAWRVILNEIDNLKKENEELKELTYWENDVDLPLPEDDEIKSYHPIESGRHDLFNEAVRLVGAKQTKYSLVNLVNWLLHKNIKVK